MDVDDPRHEDIALQVFTDLPGAWVHGCDLAIPDQDRADEVIVMCDDASVSEGVLQDGSPEASLSGVCELDHDFAPTEGLAILEGATQAVDVDVPLNQQGNVTGQAEKLRLPRLRHPS